MAKGSDAGPAQTPLRARKDSAMFRSAPRLKYRRYILPLGVVVVAALVLLTTESMRSAQNPPAVKNGDAFSPPAVVNDEASLTTSKEKAEPKKSKLEKTKTDAAELAVLADKLRDELNKMNVNVLSLDVIQKTEEVEKLAKKIKGEAYEH